MRYAVITLALCICVVWAYQAYRVKALVLQALTPKSMRLEVRTIAAPRFTLNEIIRAASAKYQVKPTFVKSIIAAESGFSPGAVSPKGAIGLMQLMPETAREFGADPTVAEQNVEAGTQYLSSLLRMYAHRRDQLRRAIAAYNAGPGAVKRYHGVPPYRETRHYVARVLRLFKRYESRGLES